MAFNETNEYLPGDVGCACFFCADGRRSNAGVPERIFRTDADTSDGFVVICETCGSELAALLGWMKPADVRALKAKNTDLAKQVKEATRALEAAVATVESLRTYDEVVGA